MNDEPRPAARGRRGARVAAVLGLALALAAGGNAATAQPALVSASQPRSGELLARTSIDAQTVPQASEFTLQLDPAHTVTATTVAPVALPAASTALLLCLDRSGSMGAAAIETMQEVFRRTLVPRPGETQLPVRVAIVAFGTRPDHLLGLTSDPAQVAQAIGRLKVERAREGRTLLYDAVAGGLAELRNSDATYKRLLVVSDGNDEGSSLSQKALIERTNLPPSIAVDAVGFGALAAASSGSLATLAGATGGRFGVAQGRTELGDALAQMIRQFVPRPQYDVRFAYPPDTAARPAGPAVLWYRPRGGPPVSFQIGADVLSSAPAERPDGKPPGPADDGPATPGSRALRFVVALPLAARIGAALGLLVLLGLIGIALRRRRAAEPLPDERAPIGPTWVDAPIEASGGSATGVEAPVGRDRHTRVAHRWPSPGDGRTVAVLHGVSGAAQGQRLRVTTAEVRIGAAPDNDLVLHDDDFVSGHHGVLKAEANGLYVVDLGSRNGSALNGVKFTDATRSLSPGDRVTLGRSAFDVLSADPRAGPADPEPRVD